MQLRVQIDYIVETTAPYNQITSTIEQRLHYAHPKEEDDPIWGKTKILEKKLHYEILTA